MPCPRIRDSSRCVGGATFGRKPLTSSNVLWWIVYLFRNRSTVTVAIPSLNHAGNFRCAEQACTNSCHVMCYTFVSMFSSSRFQAAASLGNSSRAPSRAILLKSSSSKTLEAFRSCNTREAINLGATPRSVPSTM